jgi:hypothetical protein
MTHNVEYETEEGKLYLKVNGTRQFVHEEISTDAAVELLADYFITRFPQVFGTQ